MNLVLDTNRYTDFCRGDAAVVDALEHAAAIYVPLIVLGELRAGFACGSRTAENEDVLQKFLAKPGVYLLLPDAQTTRVYAEIFRQLRRQATPIPTNDLWIAALVIQHGLTLYARDAHFDRLSQLPRL